MYTHLSVWPEKRLKKCSSRPRDYFWGELYIIQGKIELLFILAFFPEYRLPFNNLKRTVHSKHATSQTVLVGLWHTHFHLSPSKEKRLGLALETPTRAGRLRDLVQRNWAPGRRRSLGTAASSLGSTAAAPPQQGRSGGGLQRHLPSGQGTRAALSVRRACACSVKTHFCTGAMSHIQGLRRLGSHPQCGAGGKQGLGGAGRPWTADGVWRPVISLCCSLPE